MSSTRRLLVLACLAAAVAVSGASAAQSQADRASLRLVSDAPTTLRGAGFHPRERVRLVVTADRRVVRTLVATAAGRFLVRLPGVDAGACQGFSATATGIRGSRAWVKRAPGMCPYPADPG